MQVIINNLDEAIDGADVHGDDTSHADDIVIKLSHI